MQGFERLSRLVVLVGASVSLCDGLSVHMGRYSCGKALHSLSDFMFGALHYPLCTF